MENEKEEMESKTQLEQEINTNEQTQRKDTWLIDTFLIV